MIVASVTEVRKRFEEFALLAENGETIVITRWGKPVADMRPHQRVQKDADQIAK